jgi:hypothetical protein
MATSPSAPTTTLPSAPPAAARLGDRRAGSATRGTVSAIGVIIALAGVEHGVGEVLQGNVDPGGTAFESWPTSDAFRILAGEPAMTIVPNLRVTGILAILVSLTFFVWVTAYVQRRHGGLVLVLLSVAMLLFGAGFGPPVLGIALGITATRIGAPLGWWHTRVPPGLRRLLAVLWPWALGADVVAWLALLPGVVLAGSISGADAVPEALVYVMILSAVGFMLLAILTGLARDSLRPAESLRAARA